MSDLWVVLLDASSSMGESFSSDYQFAGHVDTGAYATKIEAAKDRLLKELHGLGDSHVAVISFSDSAELVCRGSAASPNQFRPAIEGITADGRTNIAAALRLALYDVIRQTSFDYVSILLISDGLSNVGDPIAAADECRTDKVPISTILIDPTPEGENLAKAISHGGRVTAVTSSDAFGEAVGEAAREHKVAAAPLPAAQLSLLGFVTALTAVIAVSVTISGVFTAAVEKPTTAIPVTFAAFSFIASCVLFFIAVVRERSQTGIYISQTEMHYPNRFKYERRTRLVSIVCGFLCLLLSVGLGILAYINVH
ncbi:MAG: VWA domain-containing protein [Burkholderiales bacterium]